MKARIEKSTKWIGIGRVLLAGEAAVHRFDRVEENEAEQCTMMSIREDIQ